MPNVFNHQMFADVVGSSFKLIAPEATVEIELSQVSDLKETPFQQVFSLIFLIPKPYNIAPNLFDLEHEKLGPMQLFLAPVGAADDGRLQAEAVFNLLRDKEAGS